MYIPKFFKVSNIEEIQVFIQHNSFGTLVTTRNGKPIATHLPFQLVQNGTEAYLTGHVAYGNPQWRTLGDNEDVLVMFQGPHAYISSSWYGHENVPTWNYQAVHIYGSASLLTKEEMEQDLISLLQKYEKHRENPILWETLTTSLLEKELKGIVGFKIKIKEMQAASKLSQNRNESDYHSIIQHLYKEKDIQSKEMAKVMEKRIN